MLGRVVVAALLAGAVHGSAETRQVRWNELSSVVGHTVQIGMPDGGAISGKALAVEPDALIVQIQKTNKPAAYPRGTFNVPRSTLHVLEMRAKTKRYRILSTAVFSAAGLLGGALTAWAIGGGILNNLNENKAAAAFTGIWAGATAGGYLLGNAADRHTVTIYVRE